MSINIFEGARRIAILLGGAAAVITVLVLFNKNVYLHVNYSLATPNAPFRKTDGTCPAEGQKSYFTHRIAGSDSVDVSLCLEPMTFTNKNKENVLLIPYKIDVDGRVWGAARYRTEISDYETQIQKRFTMTEVDEQLALTEAEEKWRNQLVEGMGYLAVGLAIFAALVWVIGWIVRGFLGIPMGMDKQAEKQ